ncbi:MAG: response regulator [bacterium]
MTDEKRDRRELAEELERLHRRMAEIQHSLRALDYADPEGPSLVGAPPDLRETFRKAQKDVTEYFSNHWSDPPSARIVYSGERYILIRAASMSTEFFDLVTSLYRDRGPEEARSVASGFLFDVAHALGKADAAAFHTRMGVVDPLEKLSAGPVHFAYAGWGLVDIHPESAPSPDEHFFLYYDHPNSFEAQAWLKRDERPDFPVCFMSSGYSSGWCEQSYGVPLVATELTCRAKGDPHCRFVMAHPAHIQEHLQRMQADGVVPGRPAPGALKVPEFFRRKRLEDELRRARDDLELRVTERTAELQQRNVDLRTVNERLEEMYRAREEFLAMISHELRTPLVTGLGYVELLLRGKLGPVSDGVLSGMNVAMRNLRRLAGLVDDILRYHQLSHRDKQAAMPVTFDLAVLCQECVEDLLVRFDRPGITAKVKTPDGLPPVLADEDMIRQVLANLLNNAVHHAGEQVDITITAEQLPSARARIAVSDNGVGMAPDMLKQATEPFVRSAKGERGLGLGLSIVRSLLRANDSDLTLGSVEGSGTTAVFSLPLLAEAAADLGPERSVETLSDETTANGGRRPGARVLLVDDDADTRSYIELALGEHGFDVLTVETAEDGLARLHEFDADLMLVDMCLPGMDGVEFTRRIRRVPENAKVPIFLYTARAEASVHREALEAGCDGCLVKPVAIDELLERVNTALQPTE